MRELMFKGFLTQYTRRLSNSDSLNLRKLTKEVQEGNHRLLAPLVLYAISTGKGKHLAEIFREGIVSSESLSFLESHFEDSLEQVLQNGKMPEEYLKVWHSYQVAHDTPNRDSELKEAMRKKVIQLQQAKACSNYRIYTDLKLNPGNINSWLKQGDSGKVSYETAKRVLDYVSNYTHRA